MVRRKKSILVADWWVGEEQFPEWTQVGAPTITHGASNTDNVAAALPTVAGGILAGDMILAFCSTRNQGVQVRGPVGFKKPKNTVHNNGGNGTNVGATTATFLYKEAVGGESGTLTFNIPEPADVPAVTSVNLISVTLVVLRKGSSRAKWEVSVFDGTYRNWDESVNTPAAIQCKSLEKVNLKAGDQLLCFATANTSASLFTPRSITLNAGLGITTANENWFGSGTTNGQRHYLYGSHYKITSGDQTDFLQYNATATVVALRAPWVATHFVRVRQISSTESYIPTNYEHLDPANFDAGLAQIDNHSGLYGKMKKENENHNVAVTYGIENYLGVPHFYIKHDFNDTSLNARRGEIHVGVQQPRFHAGVKLFEGLRVRWANTPLLPDQWIPFQNHTGTAAGTPNHPCVAFEFCKANQYQQIQGWMNGLGNFVPEGTLILCLNAQEILVSGQTNNKYIAIPSINYIGAGKDIPIEMMLKAGIVGSGRIILASDGVVLVDESVYGIIANEPAELGDHVPGSGNGSVAGVLGMNKWGGYLHQIPTSSATTKMQAYKDAFVNAGLPPELKHYYKGFKRSVKQPTDWDYGDEFDALTLAAMRV